MRTCGDDSCSTGAVQNYLRTALYVQANCTTEHPNVNRPSLAQLVKTNRRIALGTQMRAVLCYATLYRTVCGLQSTLEEFRRNLTRTCGDDSCCCCFSQVFVVQIYYIQANYTTQHELATAVSSIAREHETLEESLWARRHACSTRLYHFCFMLRYL